MIILIKNGHVKTMAGPDLECGDVLIENGKKQNGCVAGAAEVVAGQPDETLQPVLYGVAVDAECGGTAV